MKQTTVYRVQGKDARLKNWDCYHEYKKLSEARVKLAEFRAAWEHFKPKPKFRIVKRVIQDTIVKI